MSRTELAALAKTVAAAARAGDEISRQILTHAAEELTLAVSVAIRELGMEEMPVPVSYVGSVFESGQLIIDSFSAALHKKYPLATVAPPEFPAVIGSFFLGAREAGWTVSEKVMNRIRKYIVQKNS